MTSAATVSMSSALSCKQQRHSGAKQARLKEPGKMEKQRRLTFVKGRGRSSNERTAWPFTRTSKQPLRGFSALTETVARPASAFSRAAARVLNAPSQRSHTRGLVCGTLLALRCSLAK